MRGSFLAPRCVGAVGRTDVRRLSVAVRQACAVAGAAVAACDLAHAFVRMYLGNDTVLHIVPVLLLLRSMMLLALAVTVSELQSMSPLPKLCQSIIFFAGVAFSAEQRHPNCFIMELTLVNSSLIYVTCAP